MASGRGLHDVAKTAGSAGAMAAKRGERLGDLEKSTAALAAEAKRFAEYTATLSTQPEALAAFKTLTSAGTGMFSSHWRNYEPLLTQLQTSAELRSVLTHHYQAELTAFLTRAIAHNLTPSKTAGKAEARASLIAQAIVTCNIDPTTIAGYTDYSALQSEVELRTTAAGAGSTASVAGAGNTHRSSFAIVSTFNARTASPKTPQTDTIAAKMLQAIIDGDKKGEHGFVAYCNKINDGSLTDLAALNPQDQQAVLDKLWDDLIANMRDQKSALYTKFKPEGSLSFMAPTIGFTSPTSGTPSTLQVSQTFADGFGLITNRLEELANENATPTAAR